MQMSTRKWRYRNLFILLIVSILSPTPPLHLDVISHRSTLISGSLHDKIYKKKRVSCCANHFYCNSRRKELAFCKSFRVTLINESLLKKKVYWLVWKFYKYIFSLFWVKATIPSGIKRWDFKVQQTALGPGQCQKVPNSISKFSSPHKTATNGKSSPDEITSKPLIINISTLVTTEEIKILYLMCRPLPSSDQWKWSKNKTDNRFWIAIYWFRAYRNINDYLWQIVYTSMLMTANR